MLPESERYKDSDPFLVRCRSCQGEVAFAQIGDRDVSFGSSLYFNVVLSISFVVFAITSFWTHVSRMPVDAKHCQPANTT